MKPTRPTWADDVEGSSDPTWANGVPACDPDMCAQYDGKRCKLTGFRPDRICEPAVIGMAEALDRPTA